ncbi:hypothetical protein GGQ73_000155 [Rhizobium skierniewicense]|uniref:Uncharacterized protein n=1 Tax=Rhizobium skierniewicense TaxID=984260 RepID=A0A7W6C1U8_9HYPH|nr:hypothetical protein [Rhizobium skierniewicense]
MMENFKQASCLTEYAKRAQVAVLYVLNGALADVSHRDGLSRCSTLFSSYCPDPDFRSKPLASNGRVCRASAGLPKGAPW